jgi:thiol-disulfide isomerase/thioredoxin
MINFFKKEFKKFKKKSLWGKITDVLFILLIILLLIPATRKELMTYASKVRMLVMSPEKNEETIKIEGAKSLVFTDEDNNKHALNEYYNKPVFINFWATWCPPCRAEMPSIQKLYNDYGEKVHFLILSDEPMKKQQKFLDNNNFEIPVYQVKRRPSGSFEYSVLPTTMIISGEQEVILRKEGAVNWNSKKVRKMLDDLIES